MSGGRFFGKTVMITGAAGGFGAEAARRFGQEGAQLVLSDLDKSGLKNLEQELHESTITVDAQLVDLNNENEIESHIQNAEKNFAPIDVAINNAGIGQSMQPLTKVSVKEFDRVMAVNARGVFLCMKHQLPGMIARRAGAILNISSAAGLIGAGQLSAYAASKHAVIGLTRSAADEVAKYGIRVNALCPSFAPTPLFNEMADDVGGRHGIDRDEAYARISARIPMRRLATIDEVVQAMLWACDPANSFMTGQAIAIDGGLTAI